MNDLGDDFWTVRDFLGADQVDEFQRRFCVEATNDEVAAAGFDIEEVLPEDKFHRLVVCPSQVFKIPGFREFYGIQGQWVLDQIIHPWWM